MTFQPQLFMLPITTDIVQNHPTLWTPDDYSQGKPLGGMDKCGNSLVIENPYAGLNRGVHYSWGALL